MHTPGQLRNLGARKPAREIEGVRGRVLLVFQDTWAGHGLRPGLVAISAIARELGVSRQLIYRACPELRRA